MYENIKDNSLDYPDNLIKALNIDGITQKDIERTFCSPIFLNYMPKDTADKSIAIITRYFIGHEDYKSIGKTFEISPGRVGQLIRQILHAMREVLEAKTVRRSDAQAASDYIEKFGIQYTSVKDGIYGREWRIHKPGGNKPIVALYTPSNHTLTIAKHSIPKKPDKSEENFRKEYEKWRKTHPQKG